MVSSWLNKIWDAGQAKHGNFVRRSVRSVLRNSSLEELTREVRNRGHHMAQVGDQYIIVCNEVGTISVIC